MAVSSSGWTTVGCVLFFAVIHFQAAAAAADAPAIEPDAEGILFVLGEEDGTRDGYQNFGWSEIDVHACTIGVDCHTEPFPSHIHASSKKPMWGGSAVERLTITFNLASAREDSFLRLVRAGAETISVRLDEREQVLVKKSMMQPETFEHSGFGAYDLRLDRLEAGSHVLTLTVAEDGEGNGRFGWDAIVFRTSED